VVNRFIELQSDISPERLAGVERSMNAALVGKRALDIAPLRDALCSASGSSDGRVVDADTDAVVSPVVDEILDALHEADRDRLYHVGVPALLAQPEFHDAERARPLIEFLEDGIALLEALSDVLGHHDLVVRIGHENRAAELGNVSLIATNYGGGSSDGIVGVIGPTRMDYPRAFTAVRSVAHGLEDILSR
jgi:heat-inducible transcriptional repressor